MQSQQSWMKIIVHTHANWEKRFHIARYKSFLTSLAFTAIQAASENLEEKGRKEAGFRRDNTAVKRGAEPSEPWSEAERGKTWENKRDRQKEKKHEKNMDCRGKNSGNKRQLLGEHDKGEGLEMKRGETSGHESVSKAHTAKWGTLAWRNRFDRKAVDSSYAKSGSKRVAKQSNRTHKAYFSCDERHERIQHEDRDPSFQRLQHVPHPTLSSVVRHKTFFVWG